MRSRVFDVDPSVPHNLVSVEAVLRDPHRVDLAAAAVIFGAAIVRVRVGEDDVDAAGTDAAAGAGAGFPVIEPAPDILDGVAILIAVVVVRRSVAVERAVAVLVIWRRELVPIFAKAFVAG